MSENGSIIVSTSKSPVCAGVVRIPVSALAALFGDGARIDSALFTTEDVGRRTITLIVRDHKTLPEIKEGEEIPQVYPEITEIEPRTTIFRLCPSTSIQ